jgi:hypothetical protein
MYSIGSPTQRLNGFHFDEDGGALRRRRASVEVPARIDLETHLPVTLVTSVTSAAFGDADLGDLYITSAKLRLTPEESDRQT